MINKAKELNKALKETSISKEYFALKEALENDEYITNLLKVIKQTQNEAKECLKNNDIENYKIKTNIVILNYTKKIEIFLFLFKNFLFITRIFYITSNKTDGNYYYFLIFIPCFTAQKKDTRLCVLFCGSPSRI